MPLYEILAIAFGLAMDAFAVSIATSVASTNSRGAQRITGGWGLSILGV